MRNISEIYTELLLLYYMYYPGNIRKFLNIVLVFDGSFWGKSDSSEENHSKTLLHTLTKEELFW